MKKVISWIKKIVLIVAVFLVSMWSKTWAAINVRPAYAAPGLDEKLNQTETLAKFDMLGVIWDLVRFLIIPLIFIIGVIVYLKKSSSSKKTKIIISLISVVVVVVFYLGTYILPKLM